MIHSMTNVYLVYMRIVLLKMLIIEHHRLLIRFTSSLVSVERSV